MSTTTAPDPALVIRAAVRDLYDRLKEVIDRGPTEDPSLLDEVRAIVRRDGGRIARTMKKITATEAPTTGTQEKATRAIDQPAVKPEATPATTSTLVKEPAHTTPATPATKPADSGDRVSVRLPAASATTPAATQPTHRQGPRHTLARTATGAADFAQKSIRGALIAVALGAVAVGVGSGLAEAGAPNILIWIWGIVAFAAFTGGLCAWAMSAAKRWSQPAASSTDVPAAAESGTDETPSTTDEPVDESPSRIISFEDESDRAYRRFVELHRPNGEAAR